MLIQPSPGQQRLVGLGDRWFPVLGELGPDRTFDFTRPGAITKACFDTDDKANIESEASLSFKLGPQGGTLTLRRIAPLPDGGFRVRGCYSAQLCPAGPRNCARLNGTFAFDDPNLPKIGNAQALIPSG